MLRMRSPLVVNFSQLKMPCTLQNDDQTFRSSAEKQVTLFFYGAQKGNILYSWARTRKTIPTIKLHLYHLLKDLELYTYSIPDRV